MKRLIKSIYVDIVRRLTCGGDYQDITIFKDPTAKEIRDIKNSSEDGIIRGVISNNDIYIWDGNVLHYKLQYPGIDIENGFRFSTGIDEWEFNNGDHTLKEIYDVIIKYKNLLQNMSSFDRKFDIISNEENKDYGTNNHLFSNFSEFEKYIKSKEEVKVSRLIKSYIYDAKNLKNDVYLEVYMNPDQREIEIIKKQHNSVRGVIDKNGDKYIWDGYIVDHYFVNKFLNNKIVPLDYFRFSFNSNGYLLCDLGSLGARITNEECREILRNNLDFFQSIYPITKIEIREMTDSPKDYLGTLDDFIREEVKVSRLIESKFYSALRLTIIQYYQ